jgi:tRNA G37 N-methylase Trm5
MSPLPIAFDRSGFFNVTKMQLFFKSGRSISLPYFLHGYHNSPVAVRKVIKHGFLHPFAFSKSQQIIFKSAISETFFCNQRVNKFIINTSLADDDSVVGVYASIFYLLDQKTEFWSYMCKT